MRFIKLGSFMQDAVGILHGRVSGLGIGTTTIVSEAAKSHDGKPYLRLIAEPLNAAYEVGVAFPKEKDGMNYYSVNLESPLFPAPLNAALFPDRQNEGLFNLIWNRPEAPQLPADATPGTTQGRRFIGSRAVP